MPAPTTLFKLISLGSILLLLCGWSYRFFFNHEIIRNYTNRRYVPKSQINDLIGKEANEKYGCTLLHVNVDDELDEEKLPTLTTKLYAELHRKHINWVVGAIFSVATALSIELVGVFMAQLVGLFEPDIQFLRVGICTLVVLVSMVQPLLVVSLYVNQDLLPTISDRSPTSLIRTISTIVLCGFWFYFLHKIGELANSLGAISEKSFIERKTNEVVLTGITITAILSGVGCALTPVRRFWTERGSQQRKAAANTKAKETQLNDLIQSYNTTKMLIVKRQSELDALLLASGGTVYNDSGPDPVRLFKGSGKQLLNKVQSFATLSSFGGDPEEEELKREIESLKELKSLIYSDLTRDLQRFLYSKRATPMSNKALEKLLTAFQVVFALYCIYRIFNVIFLRLPYQYFWSPENTDNANSIGDTDASSEALNKNTKDALAITIAKIIQSVFGYLPMSEVQLINQVSFILSGSLFVCSFQNVLITFKSLGRFLPTTTTTVSSSVKGWLKNLVVSEFLAIYIIATALLIRTNLPEETAKLMLRILSLSTSLSSSVNGMQIEVEFIDRWFDKVFGLTCVVTIIVTLLKSFIESDNVYDDGYDEEMFIEDANFKML